MKKYVSLLDKYHSYKRKLYNTHNKNKLNSHDHEDNNNDDIKLRNILGDHLQFSLYPAGEYSYPGPDITFTAPKSNSMVVCLGCMENIGTGDNINISWPKTQIPANFATGSSGVNSTVYTDDLSFNPVNWLPFFLPELGTSEYRDFTFPNQIHASNNNINTNGQPNTTNVGNGQDISPNRLGNGINTTLQSASTAGAYIDGSIMTLTAVANNYSAVNLSQEGILWTLWPLAKPIHSSKKKSKIETSYFDNFQFGTATASNYPIGQLGFFYNSNNASCIPIGSDLSLATFQSKPRLDIQLAGQIGINNELSSFWPRQSSQQINPGVQGFYRTLLISTDQLLAVLVVKVSEEIARVPNPTSGEMGAEKFIYVGYDGWAVIRTSANPVGPMMGQTYITPQTVTGNINKENYQVVFPPNFYNQVFYKNSDRIVPVDTRSGLSYHSYLRPYSTTNTGNSTIQNSDLARNDINSQDIVEAQNVVDGNVSDPDLSVEDLVNTLDIVNIPTSLGERPIPFGISPFSINNSDPSISLITPENPGFVNFDPPPGRPTYIDGQLQLYPRFASSIRPYVQALVESPAVLLPATDDIVNPINLTDSTNPSN